MKWLWITALLFLVTGVKSGPPTRKVGDIDALKITEIDRNAQEQFTFILSKETPEDTKYSILIVKASDKETNFNSSETGKSTFLTFDHDLIQFSGSTVDFLITVINGTGHPIELTKADSIPFPDFPGDTITTTLLDPRPPKNGTLVRVEGSLGDMSLTSSETLFKGDINYFAFPGSANYTPCIKSNDVNVCDRELETSVPKCTIDDPIVLSAVLTYGPDDGNATINLSFPNTEATLEAILMPKPPPSPQSPEENVLCTEFIGSKCNIVWPDPSSKVLQLIIIQKTTALRVDDSWATYAFDIQDLELVATNLGDTILEGRWKMLPDEKTYKLTKTLSSEKETNTIEVDCSHLEDMCFGYFPHMESPGNYTLTVAPKTEYGDLNQIQSLPVEFSALQPPKLEILSRHTTTQQNQQRADVQICFQHRTQTEGRSFSHYEMLIINEKGQWLKHSLMQEEEEGGDASGERLCFTPFTINTTDFALTEATRVVVSQRAVDGISVLASGESALF